MKEEPGGKIYASFESLEAVRTWLVVGLINANFE